MALAAAGEAGWYLMAGCLMVAASQLGDTALFGSTMQAVLSLTRQPEPSGPYGKAVLAMCLALYTVGHFDSSLAIIARAEALARATPDPDPAFVLWLCLTRAEMAAMDGEPGSALAYLAEAAPLRECTGDVLSRDFATMVWAHAVALAGRCDLTEAAVRDLERTGPNNYLEIAKFSHAAATLTAGRSAEGVSLIRSLLDPLASNLLSHSAQVVLAQGLTEIGDFDSALTQASALLGSAGLASADQRFNPLTVLARATLERGRHEEALAYADQALDCASIGHVSLTTVLGVRARALDALGRRAEACADIERARAEILRVASTIEDPEIRESFLGCPRNSLVLRLAKDWLGAPASG
jgi:hypothetical protein